MYKIVLWKKGRNHFRYNLSAEDFEWLAPLKKKKSGPKFPIFTQSFHPHEWLIQCSVIHWGGWKSGILLPGVPPLPSPPSKPTRLRHMIPWHISSNLQFKEKSAPVTRKGDTTWGVKNLQLTLPIGCRESTPPIWDVTVPLLHLSP